MMLPYLIGGIAIVALLLYALWRVVDMLDNGE